MINKLVLVASFIVASTTAIASGVVSKSQKSDTTFIISSDDEVLAMIDSIIARKFTKQFSVDEKLFGNGDTNLVITTVEDHTDSIIRHRLELLNRNTPFDLVYNDYVKAFIKLYADRRRQLTSNILGLAPFYFPMFEEVLDRYDMPLELKYLAVIESALNPQAKSRVGAMGLWQFMYRTGKMYDLNITSYYDERMDPYKSTVAACEFMTDMYKMYGDWNLVLAAYNSGAGNVNKAIRRSGGKRDYWEIINYLPRETRGYVPAFIAVNYIMNYSLEHQIFPTNPQYTCIKYDTVMITKGFTFKDLSTYIDMPVKDIAYFNPMYKAELIPTSDKPLPLCLPSDKIGLYLTNETNIYADLQRKELADSIADVREEEKIVEQNMVVHRVRSGEYLGSIANKYKVSVSNLMAWNNMRSTRLNPGDRLTIYTSGAPDSKPVTTASVSKKTTSGEFKYHVIQPGDTLWDIAKKYNGITVNDLKQMNNHLNFKHLKPGMKIKVPVAS
ncbi:lytic transglycosylase domain-containing protein [Acidiluteibacter ferrifornacis]|uniref:LysM peptidoglycan-binding domain-containing protein n=1 Tax=Acidiluteibacter ferrifornacis TaxID=2692424 RepID=A0A6N9NGT2_9FLAO|nr:lytic transglycosylase domain-containing protein [Acidiluteibacter ferrifornacis]MBR9831003.1 LysM peptidoglycan-binding domain-containing protein [bacterium]NBG65024.1 LysM peptidoglycan-binding domain-containing protein [Acidiluteibacter ferrifornacis]